MSTRIVCPNCHAAYNATDDQRGQRVRCRQCQAIFYATESEDWTDTPAGDDNSEEFVRATPDPDSRIAAGQAKRSDSRPPPRKRRRRLSALVLLLLMGGAGGSLFIVASSVFICLWLWNNPPDTWWTSKKPDVRIPAGGRQFVPVPDVRGEKGDDEAKEAAQPGGEDHAQVAPPPPPRELAFVSPPPKAADLPAPAKAPANSQLPPDLIQKVKRATVYLRVTLADGNVAQGSGFFGVESNIVLTNAHVIGMLRPESRRPQKIEVVLNSGTAEERKLHADLLGVDRNADLAVLRVAAPNLPPPLPVRSARNLQETQQVYVFGFPFGTDLGKEITVSQSSVSSLRWEPHGMLARVQVNGGMHPGNSGGPVVDTLGNVIGVAVSVLRFTQINFAVPGDQVHAVLQGRVLGLALGQPYQEQTQINVSAKLEMIDPLVHVGEPALEVWTGEPDPPARPPSATPPSVQAGDSPHQRYPLTYQDQVARADILLPPLPPGKVYWVQPRWTNADGVAQWATANVYPLPPPVERKPVPLLFRHQTGSRGLVLNSWLDFKTPGPNGTERTWTVNSETRVTETTEAVDAEELASVRLQYRAYNVEFSEDSQDLHNPGVERAKQTLEQARHAIKQLAANLRIDKQGNLVGNEVDLSRVPPELQPILANVHEDLGRALLSTAVPLPNKQVEPGESWKTERNVPIPSLGRSLAARLDLTCTYLGIRKRAGHEEAVLHIEGPFRAPANPAGRGTGRADGTACVDVANGQVTQADMVLVFDVETNQLSRLLPGHGKLTLRLQRDPLAQNLGD
ncbi:MAG TPA: trypsin-like peptidase domain-containing protein [Gemmataceae bacterium]|nr:trypsin-like peptidase domain-containing protein [Gemmataceae bacterium]